MLVGHIPGSPGNRMDDALLNICELLYLAQLYGYIAM